MIFWLIYDEIILYAGKIFLSSIISPFHTSLASSHQKERLIMSKQQVNCLEPGSAVHVIAHARWAKTRGRKPSMVYGSTRNPQEALARATQEDAETRRTLLLCALKHGDDPRLGYTSISGRHFSDPEQALTVAGYEAMILSLVEEDQKAITA